MTTGTLTVRSDPERRAATPVVPANALRGAPFHLDRPNTGLISRSTGIDGIIGGTAGGGEAVAVHADHLWE